MFNIYRKNTFRDIMSLQSGLLMLSSAIAMEINAVSEAISASLASSGQSMSADIVQQLLFILQCNAHRVVVGETRRTVGLGLYPMASMLNHSCSPNCVLRFRIQRYSRPHIVIVATQDIPPGVELTYNYIPLYQSTRERKEQLRWTYGFNCQCARCYSQCLECDKTVHNTIVAQGATSVTFSSLSFSRPESSSGSISEDNATGAASTSDTVGLCLSSSDSPEERTLAHGSIANVSYSSQREDLFPKDDVIFPSSLSLYEEEVSDILYEMINATETLQSNKQIKRALSLLSFLFINMEYDGNANTVLRSSRDHDEQSSTDVQSKIQNILNYTLDTNNSLYDKSDYFLNNKFILKNYIIMTYHYHEARELVHVLDIAHRYLFQSYRLIAHNAFLISQQLYASKNLVHVAVFYYLCISFSALALGCIYGYTRSTQQEAADLEYLISSCILGLTRVCINESLEKNSFQSIQDVRNCFKVMCLMSLAEFPWLQQSMHREQVEALLLSASSVALCDNSSRTILLRSVSDSIPDDCQVSELNSYKALLAYLAYRFAMASLTTTVICRGEESPLSLQRRAHLKLCLELRIK